MTALRSRDPGWHDQDALGSAERSSLARREWIRARAAAGAPRSHPRAAGDDAAARGVVLGVLLSLAACWAPLAAVAWLRHRGRR
jgi:hypothetical protein